VASFCSLGSANVAPSSYLLPSLILSSISGIDSDGNTVCLPQQDWLEAQTPLGLTQVSAPKNGREPGAPRSSNAALLAADFYYCDFWSHLLGFFHASYDH
jgi:hypothetical protein